MAKAPGVCKYDPNTEIFQTRAQEKKAEVCKKQWHERWSWLLEEKARENKERLELTKESESILHLAPEPTRRESMKPVPVTTNGFYGWLASKKDCALDVYTSWIARLPLKAADPWERPDYLEKKK